MAFLRRRRPFACGDALERVRSMNQRVIQDITEFIFMEDALQKSDIIFIPGTSKSAITEKAAQLYLAGYARYIMPSGLYSSTLMRFAAENIDNPRYAGEYDSEFTYCKHILLQNGVPESAILCEDRATNSMENAMYSAQVLKDAGISIKRGIICCQAFHARRAFMSYSHHFQDAVLLIAPTVTQGISKQDWYKSEKGYKKVMGELAKCGAYFKDEFDT